MKAAVSSSKPVAVGEKSTLSILHLNAYDHHGGAERLVADLIAAQQQAGHHSLALVGHKTRGDSQAIAFEIDPDLARRKEFQRGGWPDYEFRGSHRLPAHPAVQDADVIHAHNLYGGYFHPFSLIGLSQSRPLIWSIHDMQALTGYCSHSLDCARWETGCGDCPDLTRPGPTLAFDNTAALWRDKQLISDNSRLWIVGASSWIVAQLQRSLLGRHPIQLIPNGIDTSSFYPVDRDDARRELGLPPKALIVGSLARSGVLAHPWKGGKHVRATLEALREEHPEMLFLNIGSSESAAEPWIRRSTPASPEKLRLTLSALDFFLYPSIADTAPLSVMEAMACGLAVVGFRIGGMPDFVTEREGFLVTAEDTQALTEAARRLATDAIMRQEQGAAARERAVTLFDTSRMAEGYEVLYRQTMTAHAGDDSAPRGAAVDARGALEEIRRVQGEMLAVEGKLREHRERRASETNEIERLLEHRWVKLGLRIGLLRGPVKKWLRRKERERARRRVKEALVRSDI